MKLRSFRLRIALLSAALAGSSLMGFSLASWWLIYQAKIAHLDAELKNQLLQTGDLHEGQTWQDYESKLTQNLGIHQDTPVIMTVRDREGNFVFESINQAPDINIPSLLSSLPPPPPMLPFPPRPPRRPPPDFRQPPPDDRHHRQRRPDKPPNFSPPPPTVKFITQHSKTGFWRVGLAGFPHRQVAIAVSFKTIDQEMASIRNIFLVSIPTLLLLIGSSSWLLAGRALKPLKRLTSVIQQVTAKGLDNRVPMTATDVELLELIKVFNKMLERLERSFKQASRFSGDAAHELKTPLAILQGELEQMLQQAETGSLLQQNISNLLDEVNHLSVTTRKLLLLSLADAGQMRLYRTPVSLSEILVELSEDVELLAPDITVNLDIKKPLIVSGDHDLITQVLQNLVSNAVKYNLPNGWINIQGYQQGNMAIVTVTNCSKDILKADRDRIFDRFYRGDPARSHHIEGVGLGLSLAKEIALAHHGNLILDPPVIGQTGFTLTLPISQE